ncbi:MAG: hypothetical protein P8Q14_12180 [Vicingaceae bacterium]|nr:hypothetical protein [Vicingaceae bacterium]
MRKIKILCALLLLSSATVFAQKDGKKIDELTFLYIDGKYDKAVNKGEALMQNDDYKKHPLIYVYTSMSYFEMSKKPGEFSVGEKDSKFPKPIKMAQKWLYKFNKVDKKAPKYYDKTWSGDKEFQEYAVNLADTSNKIGQYMFLDDKFRKSASIYKNAFRAVPSDPVLQLWQGVGEILSKNTSEGKKTLALALKSIDKDFEPSKATSSVIAHGMVLAEELFRKYEMTADADKAKGLIEVFKKYDPDVLNAEKMAARKKKTLEDGAVMRKFESDEDDDDNKGNNKNIIIDGQDISKEKNNSSGNEEDKLDKLEKEAKDDKD